jgi:hypothetical protein
VILPAHLTANGHNYTVVDDVDTVYRALITGSVVDEVVSTDPLHTFTVIPDRPGMRVTSLHGGLFCLAGYPELVFPDLATTSYIVNLIIQAPGHRDATIVVSIPQKTAFPVHAPIIMLRPLPVRVQGRVVDDVTRFGLPGATVRIDPTPGPPHMVVLRGLLHFDHPVATVVQQQSFSNAGAAKQVAADVVGGEATIMLDNRTGLAPGSILRLGAPQHLEFGVIDTLAPTPTSAAQPGNVTLTAPLHRSLSTGTTVQRVNAGAVGVVRHLAVESNAGDGVVLLDGTLTAATVAVLDAVPARVEYGALGAVADSQGFYALNGVGRVRGVDIEASAAAHVTKSVPLVINYDRSVDNVDLRLSP